MVTILLRILLNVSFQYKPGKLLKIKAKSALNRLNIDNFALTLFYLLTKISILFVTTYTV
uniref:Uncharacterized protein n=1 Tax=OCS116 cluster bacterium TaxID=2030921 RepID=A0A2A4Z7Z9_9PROT